MAAIEEMKPLLAEVKRIRDKYGLACAEVRARNFFDESGNYSVITADDNRYTVEIGEAYGLSWRDFEDESLENDYAEFFRHAEDKEEVE
jgi:hypothetical protein